MDTENNYNYEEDEDNLYEKLQKENEEYVKIFESDLLEKGLSAKTVNRHISNIDFYLNHFLLYGDLIPMKHGCGMVDAFLGEFFIRKCMWSTPGTIKSTAASIKKFYKCMVEKNLVEKDAYTLLCEVIRDNMEEWQDRCSFYNDPDEINPFSIPDFF